MKKYFVLTALVCLFMHSNATNYYFSSSAGNDTYTSTQAKSSSTPWKSLSKIQDIASVLVAGDSILLKRGDTFFGSISFTKYGTANPAFVVSAYGTGSKPVITGLITLSNWVSIGNGIWESSCPSCGPTVNVLLLNNVLQEIGRYPNSDAPNKGYLKYEVHSGNTSITDKELTTATNWTGAEAVIRKNRFVIDRSLVQQQNGTTLSYVSTASTFSPTDNFGYFFQNHVKALDKFGEWCYDSTQKKIKVFFGTNAPTSYKIDVSAINTLVSNDYQSNIVFDNLTLKGANSNAFNVRFTTGTLIKNCDILFSGLNGVIAVTTTGLRVENNYFSYSNNNAVLLDYGNKYGIIKGNKIENTGLYQGMQAGNSRGGTSISISGVGNLIEQNSVTNSGYNGISFSLDDSITIKNNFISRYCLIKDDGGGIYTSTSVTSTVTSKGRQVIGNIVLNGIGSPIGTDVDTTYTPTNAIYLDENSSGVSVIGNTMAYGPNYGLMLHKSRNDVIRNNTVFDFAKNQISIVSDPILPARNVETVKNIFVSKTQAQLVASYRSNTNDLALIGRFDSNYYARPMDDKLVLHNKYVNNGSVVEMTYDLPTWKTKGYDLKSKKSSKTIVPFKVNKLNTANKFANGAFTSNLATVTCGTGNNNAIQTWKNDGLMDGGYLEVSFGPTTGTSPRTVVNMNLGTAGIVSSTKNYTLKFSTRTSGAKSSFGVYLVKRVAPYTRLTPTQYFETSGTRINYQALFSMPISDSTVNITFEIFDQSTKFLFDNIELYEADVTKANPDDYLSLNYNASNVAKTITLNGTYFGIDSTKYTGSVTLQPYTSLVLIKSEQKYYKDADGDTYGSWPDSLWAINQPVGYVSRSGDCNDLLATVYPGAPELCDGKDNDCDGLIDEACTVTGTVVRDSISMSPPVLTSSELTMTAFPNPTSSFISVKVSGNRGQTQLRVISPLGQIIETMASVPENAELRIGQNYKPGVYLITLTQGKETKQVKFVKQ